MSIPDHLVWVRVVESAMCTCTCTDLWQLYLGGDSGKPSDPDGNHADKLQQPGPSRVLTEITPQQPTDLRCT